MFKKFARIKNRTERLEIYNLLKFNLSACLKLIEFLILAVFISGFAWLLSPPLMRAGFFTGSAVAIGLMLLIICLMRLPVLYASSQLAADFGLDSRPLMRRLKNILALELRRLPLCWLLSVILFWGLRFLDLWVWTLAALALGAGLTTLDTFFPRLLRPEKLRPVRDDELPSSLLTKVERWTPQTGLSRKSLLISTTFSPELDPPRLSGLGRTQKVIISEKALASFPPRELSVMVVTAVIGSLVKAPLKYLLLRFCALAVAMPLSAILISTIGTTLWLYPIVINPPLITLIWAGLWLGHNMAEFTAHLTRRGMDTQLAAAASVLLKDEESLLHAVDTLAEKNLEEEEPASWREVFLPRHTRQVFIRKAKYHQHMSKFSDEK